MATQNERHVEEFTEVTSAEMMQIEGGDAPPYYLKLNGIDGEATSSTSDGGDVIWRASFRYTTSCP
jgi:hypothetical protein